MWTLHIAIQTPLLPHKLLPLPLRPIPIKLVLVEAPKAVAPTPAIHSDEKNAKKDWKERKPIYYNKGCVEIEWHFSFKCPCHFNFECTAYKDIIGYPGT